MSLTVIDYSYTRIHLLETWPLSLAPVYAIDWKKNGPTAWHLLSRENLNCSVWFVMDLNRGTMPFFILAQSWSIDFIDVILTVDNVNDLTTGFPTFINDWFNVISSLCWTVWKTWSVPRPISTTFLHRGRPSVMCNNSSRMCFRMGSIRPSGCSCWAPPVSARRRSRPSLWRRNTSTLTKPHLVIWFYSIHQYSKLLQLSQSHWKWSDDLNKLFFFVSEFGSALLNVGLASVKLRRNIEIPLKLVGFRWFFFCVNLWFERATDKSCYPFHIYKLGSL